MFHAMQLYIDIWRSRTPVHSIYWRSKKINGIYTMATFSEGNPNTRLKKRPKWFSKRPTKTRKISRVPQPAWDVESCSFLLLRNSDAFLALLSLTRPDRGMCTRGGGTMKHTMERRDGYQHRDTCLAGNIDGHHSDSQGTRRRDWMVVGEV